MVTKPFRQLRPHEEAVLMHQFTYHQPSSGQVERISKIRQAAFQFARAIAENTVEGGDQWSAVEKVREAMMLSTASVVLERKTEDEGND